MIHRLHVAPGTHYIQLSLMSIPQLPHPPPPAALSLFPRVKSLPLGSDSKVSK